MFHFPRPTPCLGFTQGSDSALLGFSPPRLGDVQEAELLFVFGKRALAPLDFGRRVGGDFQSSVLHCDLSARASFELGFGNRG